MTCTLYLQKQIGSRNQVWHVRRPNNELVTEEKVMTHLYESEALKWPTDPAFYSLPLLLQ